MARFSFVPFIFASFIASANAKILEVIVKVPANTSKSDVIYLTGDIPGYCDWQPDCVPMSPRFPFTYQTSLSVPDGVQKVELKITRGSWSMEAADWRAEALENLQIDVSNTNTQVIIDVVNWTDYAAQGVTGDLHIIPDFYSPQLGNSRSLRIWLPPGYHKDSSKRYPVIYMHDGQNLFDPAISNYGADWQVDEVMTSLIAGKKLSGPAIVVGVDSTTDRFGEYDYTLRGSEYADFLIHTVKPWVDQNLRTRPGRESTFTMGSSMGALISFALVWKHSEVFSVAGALSLPVAIQNWAIYKIAQSSGRPSLPIKIYMDHGTAGLDEKYLGPAQDFYKYLLKTGMKNSDLKYLVFDFADHNEANWARRVDIPLQWILNSNISSHRLSSRVGFWQDVDHATCNEKLSAP